MKLRTIRISVSVLMTLTFQSDYGAPSAFAEALRSAFHGDQKVEVQPTIADGSEHRLRTINDSSRKLSSDNIVDIERASNDISNKLSLDNIVDIGVAKFFVPNYPIDLIQSHIVDCKTFFENYILQELQSYIKKDAVILDIGANIGNHSVYWGIRSDIKRIYSFEPVHNTFNILKRNIEINELANKVKIFNIGLSNEKINGSISHYDPTNIGGTSVQQDSAGDLLLDKLDNIEIEEDTIDFLKIDVEGHELKVFQGARETLLKYKPIIFVESFPNKKPGVDEFLTNLGYRLEKSFEGYNYLYIFNDKNC